MGLDKEAVGGGGGGLQLRQRECGEGDGGTGEVSWEISRPTLVCLYCCCQLHTTTCVDSAFL